ncbi:MAG: PQQ-binding-like beta-propeller repeat protein [Leptothrix ochracea]|uniref:outer membrane protein assembly factor BamB family protein n=1 Tax=Leptothrix ochracea TaxID=735331 RepID=UPI0034E1A8F1
MKTPSLGLVWAAVLCGAAACSTSVTAGPVKVTPEMQGAGIVSSGVTLPSPPLVTGNRKKPVASWGKPLPYPIVIADRRNNRLIEVAPDKRILWEFPSPNLKIYRGNEDVNFSMDGKTLAVSEEDNYDVHMVDYDSRTLIWTYGTPDESGKDEHHFNYPDDAHLLEDGKFLTADIRNCRVRIIDPKTDSVATEWGKPGKCEHNPPHTLAWPNGATPLSNGDILVSEISGAWISRITREGKVLWSVQAPGVHYPSDAFMTEDGQVIVADFVAPGQVVIFDPATKKVSWKYRVEKGDAMLTKPSLARELPDTHDIIVADDLRDRVVVIDRQTKKIIWQYGEIEKKGHTPGLLNYPDGFDLDVFRDWKSVSAPVSKKIP